MKLIKKFTLWYLCITLSCTLVGSFITYYNIKHRIDKAATKRLTPEVPVAELFKRFKKSNQCNNSIGIGLSIVKQICELNGFTIEYKYEDGWHTLQVILEKDIDNLEAFHPSTEEPILTQMEIA